MSAQVHQLFASASDRDAAWERYASLAKAMQDDPRQRLNREHVDRTLAAFAEYQRLFLQCLEQEARG